LVAFAGQVTDDPVVPPAFTSGPTGVDTIAASVAVVSVVGERGASVVGGVVAGGVPGRLTTGATAPATAR
jgi:hypothetical protein